MFDQSTRQIAIDHHLEFLRKRTRKLSDSDIAAVYSAVDRPELLKDGSMRSSVTVQGHTTEYRYIPTTDESIRRGSITVSDADGK